MPGDMEIDMGIQSGHHSPVNMMSCGYQMKQAHVWMSVRRCV